MAVVQILEGSPGRAGAYLSDLWDPVTGRYFKPFRAVDPEWEVYSEAFHKEAERLRYMSRPGARARDFEASWPAAWNRLKKPRSEPWDYIAAVLDSGLLLSHPLLKGQIEASVDCTGSGDPEDRNGHGTTCALLLDYDGSGIPPLLNVKVVDEEGYGKVDNLVRGIEWAVGYYKRSRRYPRMLLSLSVGTYTRRWGFLACRGNCAVCKAALAAAEQGIVVGAAAGNRPGRTACPAMAGILRPESGIVAAAGYKYDQSGVGNFFAPANIDGFLPVADQTAGSHRGGAQPTA